MEDRSPPNANQTRKGEIRREMLVRRAKTDRLWRIEASKRIADLALSLPEVQRAQEIALYTSYKSEVETTRLIDELLGLKGHLLMPRVDGERGLVLHRIDAFPEGFEVGSHGILEPTESAYPEIVPVHAVDLIFVPGVAFDRAGQRLGYGKAYYDGLLLSSNRASKIGLGFGLQIAEAIPAEPHDVPLDMLITEEGILKFSSVRSGRKVSSGGIPDPELNAPETESSLDWEQIFRRDAPLVLEIGTGNGVFLVSEAQRHPEENFIGIERSKEFFTKFKKRVVRHGVGNIRCMCVDVKDVLPQIFPAGGLSRIICKFSDPWPKRRHRERRVIRPGFIASIELSLMGGGTIEFTTDVGWYFNLAIAEFRRRANWKILEAGPREERRGEEDDDEERVVTNFERKAREVGSEVWGFTAQLLKG